MTSLTDLLRKELLDLGIRKFSPSEDEVRKRFQVDNILRLNGNENSLGPSPKAVQKIQELAAQSNRYPDAQALAFRSEIAGLYNVDIDQVVQGSGSNELIRCICEVFLNKDDECLVPYGTFKPYLDRSLIVGGKNIVSPLKEYRVDLDDMADRISPRTKLIIIVNPNNPIGTLITHNEMQQFLERVGTDRIVVFDEAYAEYVEGDEFPRSVEFIKAGYRVIMLRTLSKAYGLGGARIGYAITTPEIFPYLNTVRLRFNVNIFAQAAAIVTLRDRDHLTASIRMVWDGKRYYYEELAKLGLTAIPTSTNFICINTGVDDLKLRDAFLRRGILISPLTPSGFPGHIRVTIGTHHENETVLACLKDSISEIRGGQ